MVQHKKEFKQRNPKGKIIRVLKAETPYKAAKKVAADNFAGIIILTRTHKDKRTVYIYDSIRGNGEIFKKAQWTY
jgi:hypothetical protein